MRSRVGVLIGAVMVLLLSACAGLPTSGPVNAGAAITEDEGDSDFAFIPQGPTEGMTPQQIVEGFIAAGSGPSGNWETAQEFLAPAFRGTWKPQAGVTIYRPGERSLDEIAEDEFVLSLSPAATVDAAGALSAAPDDGEIRLPFTLARQADDEWRITEAPDGIVLDQNRFGAVFGLYSLMYFDPTWTYLVPDDRWFPRAYRATSIADALVDGAPSPWLDGAVATAFSDDARLAVSSVPVRSGTAEVSLEDGAATLDQLVLDRMQTQLAESMRTAGIMDVDMLVDEQVVVADRVVVRDTRVDARPLVLTDEAFGFFSGNAVEEIDGLSDAVRSVDAAHIEVGADRTAAAVQTGDGDVVEVRSDGAVLPLDDGPGLVPPSIDPLGRIWTVATGSPSSVLTFAPGAVPKVIPDAWAGATQIMAQSVSRDGTRIAAVVRDGESDSLWVAGIIRDADGVPTRLGERKVLTVLPGPGTDVSWLDASTVTVLYTDENVSYLYDQPMGGLGSSVRVPSGSTTVAGGNQVGAVRLRDAAGELYVRLGTNWQHLASAIRVLATQQGSPR